MQVALRGVPVDARNRPVALTGRFLICQLGRDDQVNTTETVRLQRLLPLGISKARAKLIAGMAWGEVQNG